MNKIDEKFIRRCERVLCNKIWIVRWWEWRGGREWIINSLLIIYMFVLFDHFVIKKEIVIIFIPFFIKLLIFVYTIIVFTIFLLYGVYYFYLYYKLWKKYKNFINKKK